MRPKRQPMKGADFKKIRLKLNLRAAALGHALGYEGSDANIAAELRALQQTAAEKNCPVNTTKLLASPSPGWARSTDRLIPVKRYYRANLQTPKEAQRWPSARPAKQRSAKP